MHRSVCELGAVYFRNGGRQDSAARVAKGVVLKQLAHRCTWLGFVTGLCFQGAGTRSPTVF